MGHNPAMTPIILAFLSAAFLGTGVAIHAGPMERFGARGAGTSVYFRDPDGSLLEFISYQASR